MKEIKKVLFLSYSEWNYNGRTEELLNVAATLGDLSVVTRGRDIKFTDDHVLVGNNFLSFFVKCIRESFKNRIDVLFVDNRKATIPVFIIKMLRRPRYIIYDMRELCLQNEATHLGAKVGCIFEKKFVKKADIVICANKERCNIVREKFMTKAKIINFDNIRMLHYTEGFDAKATARKYEKYFDRESFKLIATDGLNIARGTQSVVEACMKIDRDIDLYLVGPYTEEEERIIQKYIDGSKKARVHIIGKVYHDELKYLITKCDCGVVNYHMKDTNNKYCASGKIYEFLFECIPVVTSSNPPLVNMCQTYGIGCWGDMQYALCEIMDNYSMFHDNAVKYSSDMSVEKNRSNLQLQIESIIGE